MCVCVCGVAGKYWINTDRPICKDCIYGNVKYDMPAPPKKREDITRIKYSFYASGFISSMYVQCIPYGSYGLVSFVFDSRFRIFALSILIIFHWRLLFHGINVFSYSSRTCLYFILFSVAVQIDTNIQHRDSIE